ncbi:MAG: hypothetical protein VX763_05130, partial [Actinomycetota bacterium]|nr:hypothetical protein [Actinomycetota bacterium]
MTSPETFIAFAAIMFVIALIGAAIDWVGAPLRHRKFVPKAYRFPDERLFRNERLRNPNAPSAAPSSRVTHINEEAVVIEGRDSSQVENGTTVITLDPSDGQDQHLGLFEDQVGNFEPSLEGPSPNEIVPDEGPTTVREETVVATQESISIPNKHEEALRLRGWEPGGYIYNLTKDGREPSPATVKTRYWKNVGAASGSAIFGAQNILRMKEGKPPQRRNYKSGKIETM